MKGKVVLLTGGSDGIGKMTALALARKNATLVIVGRNKTKTEAAVDEIKAASGNQSITAIIADLSEMAQVREVVREFRDRQRRLDVLINNAGAIFSKRELTSEGIERTWALNHLNYFALTNGLLDLLKLSAPSRIVNVSSIAHQNVKGLNFADLQYSKGYAAFPVYGHSKLANIMHTFALARRLDGLGVTANCLHPGSVATNIGRNNTGGIGKIIGILLRTIGKSPENGAQTSIHLASSPDVAGITGKYWDACKIVPSSAASMVIEDQERLWAMSEALIMPA